MHMYFKEDCVYYGRELRYHTDMEGKHPYNVPACDNIKKTDLSLKSMVA